MEKDRNIRVEQDSLGKMELPAGALYGLESARARENFFLDYRPVNMRLVYAMVKVKKAAALSFVKFAQDAAGRSGAGRSGAVRESAAEAGESPAGAGKSGAGRNAAGKSGAGRSGAVRESAAEAGESPAGAGELKKFRAIAEACDRVLAGKADGAFITSALQGGAGTSTNMNVNEVIANLALGILGKNPGDYGDIHPLDDVNRFQSTNDVYPTALRIAAIELLRRLSDECARLQEALQKRENEFEGIRKLGRTELMDAVPVTLGAEFGAYAQAIARDRWRLYKVEERLRQVNLGGMAVGGSGAGPAFRRYRHGVIEELRSITGLGLAVAEYPMDLTQNCDVFVEVSGLLKALGVNLIKIAGDLRLMNSGPRGGLGEIRLAPLQKGSTIMAGKVNPVIPEMITQLGIRVCANDLAIGMAAARGEFELNSFIPIIADSLLESLSLLKDGCVLFRTKCIETLNPDAERCAALLDASGAFAAAYVPVLGYDTVSRIIAENSGKEEGAEKIRKALEKRAAEKAPDKSGP